MEASADEQELVAVSQLEQHLNSAAVHLAIQDQLVLGGALEGEGRFPAFVVAFGELEGFVVHIH